MSKRLHKNKQIAIRMGEGAPHERRQHDPIVTETVERDSTGRAYIKRQRVMHECRLDAYLSRGHITEAEHAAGLKFRGAYLRVVFGIKTSDHNASYIRDGIADAETPYLSKMAAEVLVQNIRHILSDMQWRSIVSICGHDEFAGTAAKRRTLQRALKKMVRYWHLN